MFFFIIKISYFLCSEDWTFPGATHIPSNPLALKDPLIISSMDPKLNPNMIKDTIKLVTTGKP